MTDPGSSVAIGGLTRYALTGETFAALLRLKRDVYAVGAAASECGSTDDRAVIRLILRNAAEGALRAFSADGANRDAAWRHVILLVDELLRHRMRLECFSDRMELKRLQAFVSENRDALERPTRLSVVSSVAI
jgi:hypothetical protein